MLHASTWSVDVFSSRSPSSITYLFYRAKSVRMSQISVLIRIVFTANMLLPRTTAWRNNLKSRACFLSCIVLCVDRPTKPIFIRMNVHYNLPKTFCNITNAYPLTMIYMSLKWPVHFHIKLFKLSLAVNSIFELELGSFIQLRLIIWRLRKLIKISFFLQRLC